MATPFPDDAPMDRLNAFIDRSAPALLGRLKRLVGIATVNPPGERYEEITGYLSRELARVGLSARRLPIPVALLRSSLPAAQLGYPRYNVLGRLRVPGAKKTIHFNAHYDVVPVSGAWRHGDPFSGTVEKGVIYGRGTADMKGSIASLLTALDAIRATRARPRMNVEVSFTADEETDSFLGARWVVDEAPIRPDYAIVMEGAQGNQVCCGHNGTLWLEVTVHGRAAHGSTPEEGVNALEKMAALVIELDAYRKRISRRTFLTPEGKVMRPTINVGGVFTGGPGAKINTVPATASFSIDRRVLAVEDHAAAERGLRSFLAAAARRIPGCRITVSKVSENFSCFTRPRHPFFKAMAASVRRVRARPTVFNVSTGFNDIHYFAQHLGIPTLGYGPGGEDIHAVDERARVRDLVSAARIYADLLTSFGG
ncbi:MAG TPA: ArgE/DapE family deacylase [Opitutaceae bacterium]|nr:ArgE/DapE family deacylase [Opitutaceae bacterium]